MRFDADSIIYSLLL